MNANSLRTVLLLGALTGLLLAIGQALGGTTGLVLGLVLALVMNFGSYWFSDRIALAFAGAREVSEAEAPELYRLVAELARRAHLPMPRVAIIEADAPNAFATGRDPQHGVVAVTTGLLRLLPRRELEGVIAHELAHIRNRDTLISAIAATIAGAIATLANLAQWALLFGGLGRSDDEEQGGGIADLAGSLVMIIVAPIAATLIQLAISRAREFEADAGGARIAGDPEALASALERLHAYNAQIPLAVNPATASLFIVQPLTGAALASWFSTHPPVEQRIARLRALAYQGGAWMRGSRWA